MKVPAIRIRQAGLGADSQAIDIYITALTLSELRGHASIDTWSPGNKEGYQRPLEPRRLREVAKYVLEQQGILPTSVLVATRSTDTLKPIPVDFDEDEHGRGVGWLDFPDDSRVWLVDGQHRFSGVNDAFERQGEERLAEYSFPVSIMWEIDRYGEMTHFNIINTRQKKMSTDIVDRHLVQIMEREGLKMLQQGARGEKDYTRASTTRIVDRLNVEPGPWCDQIAIPGVAGRDKGLVRQHAFVASLEPFMKDSWVKGRTDDDKLKVLCNFWQAAAEAWPEAFADPKEHRVQTTVGIYSLHMLLPVLIQRCLDARDLSVSRMTTMLAQSGIDSEFWSRTDGHPLTLGTGMSSIRALAQHLILSLPKPGGGEVKF